MQMLPTFGPKCKNQGIWAPQITWFTCMKICKLNHEIWTYLQKKHHLNPIELSLNFSEWGQL